MYDYGEACPVSVATSVLCERWTLQIIRELFLGSTRYSEIQKFIPNISPSLLRNRLRFLEEQGIILRKKSAGQGHAEYHLTAAGKALGPVLTEIGRWGMKHANSGMTDKQNTASGLMRDVSGALKVDELPSGKTVLQFNLTDLEDSARLFINIEDDGAQFCSQDLGFEPDVYFTTTLTTMTKIWYGELTLKQAMEERLLKVVAAPHYLDTIDRWFGISAFATGNPRFIAP